MSHAVESLVALAAAVTALGVLWRKVVRPVMRWGRRLEASVAWTEQQLQHNSGATTRDAISRIEKCQRSLTNGQLKIESRLADVEQVMRDHLTRGDQ